MNKIFFVLAFLLCWSKIHLKQVSRFKGYEDEQPLERHHRTREWCDPVLGCLNITDEWYSPSRPINLLPDSRAKINTRFYLHTREEPNEKKDYEVSVDDVRSLTHSSFDPSLPIKFIVHGYIDTGHTKWLKKLASSLLRYGDYNVLRVNWGRRSKTLYGEAVADTRVVGLEISHFVNELIHTWQIDPGYVHCIGHSLGAHACGYAGEEVTNMGRITGLDPAGPYFTGTPDFVHLDPTDAMFVDAIHTDAASNLLFGYGTDQAMGNIDFFVNSGNDQPGCSPIPIAFHIFDHPITDEIREAFACSHLRAVDYFIESLDDDSGCQWLAHECHDYFSFEQGQCYSCSDDGSRCAYMGIRAEEYSLKSRELVKFYLDTDKRSPFCMEHFSISILTGYPSKAEPWVMGHLFLWLYGDNGEVIKKLKITDEHERIDHGQVTSKMFLLHENVGHLLRIELKWVYDDQFYNPATYCHGLICDRSLYVQTVVVRSMNHMLESETQFEASFCDDKGQTTRIKDGHKISFTKSYGCTPVQ